LIKQIIEEKLLAKNTHFIFLSIEGDVGGDLGKSLFIFFKKKT